ncbi:MAG TPA: thioredoxin family protein [Bacteroidia bacterium]|nr:thioredoxin family protein [Bacteroidia bacterium]
MRILFYMLLISTSVFSKVDFNFSQLEELREVSVNPHGNLLVFISSNGCKYCARQKKLILSNDDILNKVNLYSAFHINKDVENHETIDVPMTPAIIIFDSDNVELVRYYGLQNETEMNQLLDEYISYDIHTSINEYNDDLNISYIYYEDGNISDIDKNGGEYIEEDGNISDIDKNEGEYIEEDEITYSN